MSVRPGSAQSPEVLLRLSTTDARALDALFVQLSGLDRELTHARETAGRRGDEASAERVLDLECEHHCQAERVATTLVKVLGPQVHAALGAAR
jgi:hypothetical protein